MKKIISNKKRKEILNSLREKGVIFPCRECGKNYFHLVNGYFINNVISHKNENSGIPSVVIICDNCGHIKQHDLRVLFRDFYIELLNQENSNLQNQITESDYCLKVFL